MVRVYLAAVDVVPAAVVLVPTFGLLFLTVYRYDFQKCVLCCLYSLYLSAVFSLVGIPNVTYIRPEVNLNLQPFVGMVSDFKNSVLNVLLFVPLGFFLSLLCHQYRNLYRCVRFGFVFSLLIELLQMLTFRATDVNDLITNTCGTMFGFLLARPFIKKVSRIEISRKEMIAYSLLSFAIMFFIHPFLSMLIWDSIL